MVVCAGAEEVLTHRVLWAPRVMLAPPRGDREGFLRTRWSVLIDVTMRANLPRLAGILSPCDMTRRHRSKRGHGGVPLDDVPHMPDDNRAWFVRVVQTITDRPAVVGVVDDLPRRLLPLEDGALDDGPKVGGELVVWERKRNVPKHLLRFRRARHAGIMPDPRTRREMPECVAAAGVSAPVSRALADSASHDGRSRSWDAAVTDLLRARAEGACPRTVHRARLNSMTARSPAAIIRASRRLTWNHHSLPETS